MRTDTAAALVSTSGVAKALGVSVSTVKRWVDDGVLPAHRTAGGHRKLLVADVLELARRSDLPQANLAALMQPARSRLKPATLADNANLADNLYRALLEGDGSQARFLLHGAYRRGAAIETLADDVIAPAMKRIGDDWAAGRIDVMEEHRASQLCTAALYELKALLEDRAAKGRPRALGGAVEGDYSQLPTLLAQLVLLDAGWDAVNLGPNTPLASLAKALAELRPRLLWLSATHVLQEEPFLTEYRDLYEQARQAGVAVAIGGRGMAESLRSRMPYTTYGDGLSHLAAFARTLHPRPRRPARGRPRKS